MEILKEILNNPKCTNITDTKIKIGTKEFDKTMNISIEGTTKTNYSLEQLTFFISNRHLKYTQYLRECKNKEVTSIFWSDQKIILEEIEKIEEKEEEAFYDLPESRYISKHNYKWVEDIILEKPEEITKSKITEKYKIIVSSSLTATVNLNNIEILLNTGYLEKQKDLVFDKTEFVFDGHIFVAEEDIKNWTSDDWNMLVGIFCDGSEWQIKEWGIGDVASLFYKIPTFYIVNDTLSQKNEMANYNIKKITANNNKLKNEDFEMMLKMINNYISNKK